MRRFAFFAAALGLFPAGAIRAAAAPIEVTRFHVPESIGALEHRAVAVGPAEGGAVAGIEQQLWLDAVGRELATIAFGTATPGAADILAEVRVERERLRTGARRGPVSVGLGGSTGGWHSGVGLGLGFTLGGGPREVVQTRLSVTLRDRISGRALWEGRADNVEKAGSRAASAGPAATRIAHALFTGFPGTSGATITVK